MALFAPPLHLPMFTLATCFPLFFKQVAHEIPAPDCEAFIKLGSKTICDVAEAVSLIKLQAESMYVCLTTLKSIVI